VAALASAAAQDIDFAHCTNAAEHTVTVTQGAPLELRVHALNSRHGEVFWSFLNAPLPVNGGPRCTEQAPDAAFLCAGVAIELPEGAPDQPVASDGAMMIAGLPAAPASFRFRLIVSAKGNAGSSCERSYLLKIGETDPDKGPPTAPGDLSAVARVPSAHIEIDLRWRASTDDRGVVAYLIERCEGEECTDFRVRSRTTATVFRDGLLTGETDYRFRVRAIDAAGNRSAFSNIASERTPAQGPPDHPR
jgi:hypothetical protein